MVKESMERESTLDTNDDRLRRTPSSGGSVESPLVCTCIVRMNTTTSFFVQYLCSSIENYFSMIILEL